MRDLYGTHEGINFDGRFTVAGHRGIAFYLLGWSSEWTSESWELDCSEDHDHEDFCYLYTEPEEIARTDMVRAVMVGDDAVRLVDVSDLTEISEEDYCGECGQVGCGWGAATS